MIRAMEASLVRPAYLDVSQAMIALAATIGFLLAKHLHELLFHLRLTNQKDGTNP
jgi:uncharacterized membrane protein affecting hemolysin expression